MAANILQQSACSIPSCPLQIFKGDICVEHHYQWRRNAADKKRKGPLEKWFWSYVNKTENCWLWEGPRMGPYGRFNTSRYGGTKAHRLSWELANGPIPSGLLVCHRCDVKLCVRPDHLFLGTHFDNAGDMVLKGYTSHANSDRVILTRAQVEELATELHIPHGDLLTAIRVVKYGRSVPSNVG